MQYFIPVLISFICFVPRCEVSLWLAEQMSADLSAVFPKLIIQCMSANKVLGLWGQEQNQ